MFFSSKYSLGKISVDPDQAQGYVSPDLGPICLQRLSAEDKKLPQQGKSLKECLTNEKKEAETESNMLRSTKQADQVTLNCSPEFCLMLTFWYLLKAGYDSGDTLGRAHFGPRGII